MFIQLKGPVIIQCVIIAHKNMLKPRKTGQINQSCLKAAPSKEYSNEGPLHFPRGDNTENIC